MYTIYDKQGNIQTVESLMKDNKKLYDELVQKVKFNKGSISPYYEIMYNDYDKVIRDLVKGR